MWDLVYGDPSALPLLESGRLAFELKVGQGAFGDEILHRQVRFMRDNFPRARVWAKLHPGRDVQHAAQVAWQAGADAVTVAPLSLDHVGLPLAECLRRIGSPADAPADSPRGSLLVSGRVCEGARAFKCLALGASAVGLGRAALLAADEDPAHGLARLVDALALELQMLISAVGKYHPSALSTEDVWGSLTLSRQEQFA